MDPVVQEGPGGRVHVAAQGAAVIEPTSDLPRLATVKLEVVVGDIRLVLGDSEI